MTRQKVDVIPASVRSVQNGGQLKSQTNIRVAAYCRVSTGDESQQTSYTTQKAFYKDLMYVPPYVYPHKAVTIIPQRKIHSNLITGILRPQRSTPLSVMWSKAVLLPGM